MARADRFTIERKKAEIYSDFTPNLEKNPLTGLLARLTNEESVKNSIKNLVRTMRRERFNQPLVGSKLAQINFDPLDELSINEVQDTITQCIRDDEPRAQNVFVEVVGNKAGNEIKANIIFSMVNVPQQISFSVIIKKVR